MEESAPYSVRLEADKALHLVKQGSSLLLLDLPPSLSFGIDLQMFVVGTMFRGVKMVPPGPHFIYYSVMSRSGDAAPVTGFFITGTQSKVIVMRWDSQQEIFVKLTDPAEEERYAYAVRNLEFDKNLAPYDLHHFRRWEELSNYVTPAVIKRHEPGDGVISVVAEAELVEQHPQTAAERMMVEQIIKAKETYGFRNKESGEGSTQDRSRCRYTRLPRLLKRSGAEAKDLTSLNLDKSIALEKALKESYDGSEELLLGELQFAYIAFLMGQSLEGFSQWKSIVSLMFGCQEAPLRTRTRLFVKFLEVLYHQMRQGLKNNKSDVALDDSSWFSADNFFRLLSKDFLLMLKTTQPVDGELLMQARRLKHLLESRLGWDLDNEISDANVDDDEYAPVVVMDV
ncbi:protein AAR2 homolog isoform X1 [Selaginella moellendorffii]|uniref:protein AAR2 homolog isoform X1 n=1 Tax=Selaginella moellendorffii TaxID=88036 RepID=UPI000D1C567D|nr:protein AAR2 homolog isoform X1 [Selaginella moellendorffii]|eukprot:XP_024543508.1 protein AAR2 homolog isoform X1 [Selaginella moellendorffii]